MIDFLGFGVFSFTTLSENPETSDFVSFLSIFTYFCPYDCLLVCKSLKNTDNLDVFCGLF